MLKSKFTLVFLTSLVFCFVSIFSVKAADAVILPGVFVRDIKINTADELGLIGSFIISNEDIKDFYKFHYSFTILDGDFEDSKVAVSVLEEKQGEIFNIIAGEKKDVSFNFKPETGGSEDKLTLFITIFDQNNSFISRSWKVFTSSFKKKIFLIIDSDSVKVNKNNEQFFPLAGVSFTQEDARNLLTIGFMLNNVAESDKSAKIKIETFERNFPNLVSTRISDETYNLKALEGKDVSYKIHDSNIVKPASYLVNLYFIDVNTNERVSNIVQARYVIAGAGATILGMNLDKKEYVKTDPINLEVKYIGSADFELYEGELNIEIFDNTRLIATSSKKVALTPAETIEKFSFNLNKDIKNPRAVAKIIKDSQVLSEYSIGEIKKAGFRTQDFILLLVVILIGGVAFIVYNFFKRKKDSANVVS